jgi:predicted GNAT family acetyltransferase
MMEIREGHNMFYVNDADGKRVAEIVFVPTGEHLSIIEHTDVDPSLKGQGLGKSWWQKWWKKCAASSVKLFRCALCQT